MRSGTSFFNATVFRKNVSRFWPVWGAYLTIWVILLPVMILSRRDYRIEQNLDFFQMYVQECAIYGGALLNAVFAVFSAMAVWSFLYTARATHGMACLPLRRETVFVSSALSGLLPLLAANVLVFVLTALTELFLGALHLPSLLIWLGVVCLTLLLFYGFATLCAQLTGGILVLPLVYGVLNFVAVGVEVLLRGVFARFVYGMDTGLDRPATRWFSPVVGLLTTLRSTGVYEYDPVRETDVLVRYAFQGWGLVLGYAAAGLVLLCAALLLYRARRMETAGDVVAVRVLKPVFRWCMGLGAALSLASFLYLVIFDEGSHSRNAAFLFLLGFLFLGALLGWFAAEMLMKKSFRVFHRRTWAGYGLCCLVIAAMMLSMKLDLFGYERRIPAAAEIESVTLMCNNAYGHLSTPESIEQARAVHRQIIENKAWNQEHRSAWRSTRSTAYLRISYLLTDGSLFNRTYYLVYEMDPETGLSTEMHDLAALNAVMNTRDAIVNRKSDVGIPVRRDTIYSANIFCTMTAVECARLADRDTPEDYVLWEQLGYRQEQIAALTPEVRAMTLADGVLDNAVNSSALWDSFTADMDTAERARARAKRTASAADLEGFPAPTAAASYARPYSVRWDAYSAEEFLETLDWDQVFFPYMLYLTPAEAYALYEDCLRPEIESGDLGRIWVAKTEDYLQTVYDARINLDLRQESPRNTEQERFPDDSGSFYTYATVDSALTNAWLRARGLTLHTVGEVQDNDLLWSIA